MPTPEFTTQTTADDLGSWNIEIETSLEPGLHNVVITDEFGNSDTSLLFVEPAAEAEVHFVDRIQEYTIDRVETVVHPVFAWASLFFFLIIVILAVNEIRLARRADLGSVKVSRKRHFFKWAIVLSIFAIVASLGIGAYIQKETNVFNVPAFLDGPLPETVNVTGAVITPLTRDAVEGLDLTAGNTHIRTQEGARFTFQNMDRERGIRINHPELKRSIVVQPTETGGLDLIFDVDLFNTTIEITNAEAKGRFEQVVPHLIADVQKLTYAQELSQFRGSIFGPGDENAQELIITPIVKKDSYKSPLTKQTYGPVFEFYVLNEERAEQFLFIDVDGTWRLLQ